ncbi:hypothetical protein B0T45_13930 [Chromobacterium haemolyticum]|uniref:Uncharacterized protein n=1 Tax=Chromobacterium haemolyticum TaxID=394935 RepID=A0A1W0CSE2_9NEIS|nr:hypothetical protein B0T45_13930 [Chromobacterium haemolyticum]
MKARQWRNHNMAKAFFGFPKTVLVSKLAFVKENKLYQQLRGKRTQDGLEYSGTWAEFFNLLGWMPVPSLVAW